MKDAITKRFEKLKKQKNYVGLTDEVILAKAENQIKEEEFLTNFDLDLVFLDTIEKNQGKALLKKYLDEFVIENIADRQTLLQLVYFEISHQRIQDKLNSFKKNDNAIPLSVQETLIKNSDQILKLKAKLGLEKTDKSGKDGYGALELLQKKFEVYREENQGTRHRACPHCGQMILWKIRPEHWDQSKHPFFKDKILTSPHLLDLYLKNKITKQDVALVLECSEDYIDWILDKARIAVPT